MSLCADGFVQPQSLPCPSPHIHTLPSFQDRALISSCQYLAEVWHRQAFEQEVLSLSPEPKLPQHFISTSLWAQSFSYLGLDSCSRLERIIILTAGVRMPLRGNCLCPGKYFRELLGVDRGETLRAGLAAGKTTKATAKLLISHHEREFGGGCGEEEPGEGGEGRKRVA